MCLIKCRNKFLSSFLQFDISTRDLGNIFWSLISYLDGFIIANWRWLRIEVKTKFYVIFFFTLWTSFSLHLWGFNFDWWEYFSFPTLIAFYFLFYYLWKPNNVIKLSSSLINSLNHNDGIYFSNILMLLSISHFSSIPFTAILCAIHNTN